MALSGRLFERLCKPTNIKIVGRRLVHKNDQVKNPDPVDAFFFFLSHDLVKCDAYFISP